MVELNSSRYSSVYTDNRDFFTINKVRGSRVYGERLVVSGAVEFRRWDPYRSKLCALMHKGCPVWAFSRRTDTLYLGAASGTTVSHISDICTEGHLYCVEISPRAFRKLLDVSTGRPNIFPFLGDANRPETYGHLVGMVDVIYQDIAQKDQVGIFMKNLKYLRPGGYGYLMVKARSVDVAVDPSQIFVKTATSLKMNGLKILETVRLDPLEKDHAAFLVERTQGKLK